MAFPLLQIDAFTNRPFAGNPAAVCLLEKPGDPDWMQAVASEMNLSETAFVHPNEGGYSLRWFTPKVEVELCGHATLATAHALWSEGRVAGSDEIRFSTASGLLTAKRDGKLIELDFPATPAVETSAPDGFAAAMGGLSQFLWLGRNRFDKLLVVATEQEVLEACPHFEKLAELTERGVIVTSRSSDPQFDFVSRYFAPAAGVNEDPVTGSAHCTLAPYWAEQLGKPSLVGYQASARGGIVHARPSGDRVALRGEAVTVTRGEILVDACGTQS